MNDAVLARAAKVYFDANVIIYFVEESATYQTKVANRLYDLIEREIPLATSELAIAECLFGAYKRRSPALEQAYDRLFFEERPFDIETIDFATLIAAAKLGAETGLKLIDAAHFCCAMAARCDVFLTNDRRFRSRGGVEVVRIDDL
jgi:predicted nucleic acid-binding protein